MKHWKHLPAALAVMSVIAVTASALADEKGGENGTREAPAEAASLQPVEHRFVCMVNDAVFEREQIPVEVDGKTYYGCCPMCEERLSADTAVRTAVDPVSGKPVDKATALIAARPDGTVLYFESEETLARFVARETNQR